MIKIPKNNKRVENIALRVFASIGEGIQREGTGCQTVMFFSKEPGEGVTTVTAAVAQALSQYLIPDHLLVIDADPDRRRQRFPGFYTVALDPTDYRAGGNSGLQDRLYRDGNGILGVRVLEAGSSTSALSAGQLAGLRANLQTSFPVVLIDAGALVNGAPFLWRGIADKRLLIIDAQHARTEGLNRLAPELREMGLAPDGFILNKRRFYIPKIFYRYFS